jgi:hypothetical protein
MGLRMASPWKHPTGVYYFRQRVPADVVDQVGHPIEKVSLRTKNEREAIGKFRIIAAEHQARWDEMRKGEQSFTHRHRALHPNRGEARAGGAGLGLRDQT